MRISPITNNLYFKSSERRTVLDKKGRTRILDDPSECKPENIAAVKCSNYTRFFRSDLNPSHSDEYRTTGDWSGFCRTIADEFKNQPIVHTYDFACSDGSEPYSLAIALSGFLGEEEAVKFFPIRASDIDEKILETAQIGEIPCDDDDLKRLKLNTVRNSSYPYYTIFDSYSRSNYPYVFVPKEHLRKKVNFSVDTFFKGIDNIEKSSSLVLCRNFWPYMSEDQIWLAAQKLSDRIDDTSVVVLGRFDQLYTYLAIKQSGFREIYPLIYKKDKPE